MIHELTHIKTWDDVWREFRYRNSDIEFIIELGSNVIDELEAELDEYKDVVDGSRHDTLEDVIAEADEVSDTREIILKRLRIDDDSTNEAIEEQLDAYDHAYDELKELEERLKVILPYLTDMEFLEHEVKRMQELHVDKIVFERDFKRLFGSCP